MDEKYNLDDEFNDLEDMYYELLYKYVHLKSISETIFKAGYWVSDTVSPDRAKDLWSILEKELNIK